MTEELPQPVRVDAKFLLCPEPIRLLHQHIRNLAKGGIIELQVTDPTAERDVQQFCHFLGHELLETTQQESIWLFRIRKKSAAD